MVLNFDLFVEIDIAVDNYNVYDLINREYNRCRIFLQWFGKYFPLKTDIQEDDERNTDRENYMTFPYLIVNIFIFKLAHQN